MGPRRSSSIADTVSSWPPVEGTHDRHRDGPPIDEIARRAGVGAGTVYRHFPTEDSLFEAIIADRIGQLIERARSLADDVPAGDALFAFLGILVDEAASDRTLVDALTGAGFDATTPSPHSGQWRSCESGSPQLGADHGRLNPIGARRYGPRPASSSRP